MPRDLQLQLTPRAERAMDSLLDGLVVELELLFSCFLRKRVKFPPAPPPGSRQLDVLHPKLAVFFHPVATRHCRLEEIHGETPSETLPLVRGEAFVPHWLSLDYRDGAWQGEFGYGGSAPDTEQSA